MNMLNCLFLKTSDANVAPMTHGRVSVIHTHGRNRHCRRNWVRLNGSMVNSREAEAGCCRVEAAAEEARREAAALEAAMREARACMLEARARLPPEIRARMPQAMQVRRARRHAAAPRAPEGGAQGHLRDGARARAAS